MMRIAVVYPMNLNTQCLRIEDNTNMIDPAMATGHLLLKPAHNRVTQKICRNLTLGQTPCRHTKQCRDGQDQKDGNLQSVL